MIKLSFDSSTKNDTNLQVLRHLANSQEMLLTIQGIIKISESQMSQTQIAISPAHVDAILQILGKSQVLVIVANCFLVVADAIVGVSKEMACLGLALDVLQLLRYHQIAFVIRDGLSKLPA